jgi:acetoin utilization protein AcuB
MNVKDWMSTPAILLIADVPVEPALRHLERERGSHLVVVRRGEVLGVLSRTELREADRDSGPFSSRPHAFLGDLLRGPAAAVSPHEPLERAAERMLEEGKPALPVVDEARVVGVLAESDVLRAFVEVLGAREHGARVVVSAALGVDLLDEIRKRTRGLEIRTLAARTTPAGGWEAVLRLRGRVGA